MSSRRLFDALAAGCVVVIVRVIGDGEKERLLSNLPFYHSIDWRQLGIYLSPRAATRDEKPGASFRSRTCRVEEAHWLFEQLASQPLGQLRHNAQAAFAATMDVEYNPRGVADALLQELPYVLDDTGILLPAQYLRRSMLQTKNPFPRARASPP